MAIEDLIERNGKLLVQRNPLGLKTSLERNEEAQKTGMLLKEIMTVTPRGLPPDYFGAQRSVSTPNGGERTLTEAMKESGYIITARTDPAAPPLLVHQLKHTITLNTDVGAWGKLAGGDDPRTVVDTMAQMLVYTTDRIHYEKTTSNFTGKIPYDPTQDPATGTFPSVEDYLAERPGLIGRTFNRLAYQAPALLKPE